jgi:hypothetical protein
MRPPLSLLQAWKAFLRSAFHCGGGGRFRWFVRRPGRHGCPVATVGELSEGTQLLPSSVSSPTNQRARPPLGLESDGPQSPFSVRKRTRLIEQGGLIRGSATTTTRRCSLISSQLRVIGKRSDRARGEYRLASRVRGLFFFEKRLRAGSSNGADRPAFSEIRHTPHGSAGSACSGRHDRIAPHARSNLDVGASRQLAGAT